MYHAVVYSQKNKLLHCSPGPEKGIACQKKSSQAGFTELLGKCKAYYTHKNEIVDNAQVQYLHDPSVRAT